jgi:hypothetical protein
MKRCSISLSTHCFGFISHQFRLGFASNYLPLFCFRSLSQGHSTLGSTDTRPFPDYSPKKPTIRDSEFVHQISNAIKLRRSEPLRRILKPHESKFRPDHLIWVLMNIKNNYKMVLDFFEWACLRRDPTLEVRCAVVQIAVASKDLKMAHALIYDFWAKPNLDIGLSYSHFVERLIYTYKDWGSNPYGCSMKRGNSLTNC